VTSALRKRSYYGIKIKRLGLRILISKSLFGVPKLTKKIYLRSLLEEAIEKAKKMKREALLGAL